MTQERRTEIQAILGTGADVYTAQCNYKTELPYSDNKQYLTEVVSELITQDECAATPHFTGRVLGI